MTIQQLKAFLSVCESLNFTLAAEKLYTSRQALRQNITALERELDTPLFSVVANRITLTNAGQTLYEESRPVVTAFEDMESKVFEELQYGKNFTIAISTALVPDYLPNLISRLDAFAAREHLHFQYLSVSNSAVRQQILEGKAHCGILMDLQCGLPELDRWELSAHPASLLVSSKHPLFHAPSVRLAQLRGENLCLPGEGNEFAPFFTALGDAREQLQFHFFPSFYQVYYNVRENNFLALNRFDPEETESIDFARDILIEGLPPLCAAFYTPPNPSRQLLSLQETLRAYYETLFH